MKQFLLLVVVSVGILSLSFKKSNRTSLLAASENLNRYQTCVLDTPENVALPMGVYEGTWFYDSSLESYFQSGENTAMDRPTVRKTKKRQRLVDISTTTENKYGRVTLYKVHGLVDTESKADLFYKYPILEEKLLSASETQKLMNFIEDSSTYMFDNNSKLSLFLPEVGFQLSKEVEVLISFRSNQLLFRNKEKVFFEDIDPGRSALLDFIETHLSGFSKFRYPKSSNDSNSSDAALNKD